MENIKHNRQTITVEMMEDFESKYRLATDEDVIAWMENQMKTHMKKININSPVKVILTEEGARVINADREYWATKYPTVEAFKVAKVYEKGDEYKTQLWLLMNIFGPSMINGNECPFVDCEIFIEDLDIMEAN